MLVLINEIKLEKNWIKLNVYNKLSYKLNISNQNFKTLEFILSVSKKI